MANNYKILMASNILRLLSLLAFTCSFPFAVEPSPLQDFCIADYSSPLFVNGFACKDPNLADGTDFFYSGLHLPGNTSNFLGSSITPVNAAHIPGLNTLGISMVRIDYAQWGLSPPHTHPRASEILTVLEGTLLVGFITSNPENRLISKVLRKGDVFVFPMGLIHFQHNIGYGNAVAFAAFSSQNPGAVTVANTVFGANPRIESDILTRAFAVDNSVIESLQMQF